MGAAYYAFIKRPLTVAEKTPPPLHVPHPCCCSPVRRVSRRSHLARSGLHCSYLQRGAQRLAAPPKRNDAQRNLHSTRESYCRNARLSELRHTGWWRVCESRLPSARMAKRSAVVPRPRASTRHTIYTSGCERVMGREMVTALEWTDQGGRRQRRNVLRLSQSILSSARIVDRWGDDENKVKQWIQDTV